MATAAITKRTVDAARAAARDVFIWDGGLPGFGLKVTPTGSKIYVFQYRIAKPGQAERTPARRYTIGKHGKLTPDQARTRAKSLARQVEEGIDPRQRELEELAAAEGAQRLAEEQARIEDDLSFEKVAALWLDHYEHEKDRRPSSIRLAKLVVNRHLMPKLKGRPMPHIGRAEMQAVIDVIPPGKRGIRRAVFAYASVLFGWAAKRGDMSGNPLAKMAKPEAPKARDRVLTDDELAFVWKATERVSAPFGPLYRLLILTGQRRSEVAEISWSELDRASSTWTIPAGRAKNGVAHIVPLTELVVTELDALANALSREERQGCDGATRPISWPKSGYVLTTTGRTPISGMAKAKRNLDRMVLEESGGEAVAPWRIHDLRRTLATGFQRLGIRFEVTEAVLNHVSGAKGGIAGIYQRHDWKDEKRAALNAWALHVRSLVAPAFSHNVLPFGDPLKEKNS